MKGIIEADEQGALHIPASCLSGVKPGTRYQIEQRDQQIIIIPENQPEPFWKTASPEERVKAFQEWVEECKTPAGLSDYAVSRDSIYD